MMQHQVVLAPAAGAKVELRYRVPSFTFHVANVNVGQHGRGDPRSRRSAMMSSRLVQVRNWIQARNFRTGSAGAGTSAGKPSGLLF